MFYRSNPCSQTARRTSRRTIRRPGYRASTYICPPDAEKRHSISVFVMRRSRLVRRAEDCPPCPFPLRHRRSTRFSQLLLVDGITIAPLGARCQTRPPEIPSPNLLSGWQNWGRDSTGRGTELLTCRKTRIWDNFLGRAKSKLPVNGSPRSCMRPSV